MKILFIDYGFNLLAGAERAALELMRGLNERGHSTLVFCAPIGELRSIAASAGIEVVWNLNDLDFRPDVIHAQSHLDTMIAIAGLPDIPAIYHCHGGGFGDTPPIHPRIYRYLAITETMAQRLVIESNLAPSRIEVAHNWVDLERFTNVRTPSPRPRKALLFGNQIRPNQIVAAVTEAVTAHGLELDRIGRRIGTEIENPEEVLPGYDIVFASGKSAIDAIACGCAVIVLGQNGCGEMVGEENFERVRKANFTIPVNSPPPSSEWIAGEIARFDPAGVAAVTRRLRRECGLDLVVSRMETVYEEVIAAHRRAKMGGAEGLQATGRYLRTLAPAARFLDGLPGSEMTDQWSVDASTEAVMSLVATLRQRD